MIERIWERMQRIGTRGAAALVRRPRAFAALAVGLSLLATAGAWANAPRDTLSPAGDGAEVAAWFFWLYMILDTIIFVIVAAGFFYAIVRFRKRPGDDDRPNLDLHGNAKLELIWTIIPTIVIVVLAAITIGGVFQLAAPPDREQKLIEIDVIGKQWWWEYDYKAEGITAANEMHIEEETQVLLNLTSADVMHAFWVPRVAGKRDATPGRTYPLTFKAFATGGRVEEFVGQCAELCGASHALMGIKLFVHPKEGPESYANWVKTQQQPAREPTSELEQRGRTLFKTKGCVACHSVKGVAELATRSRTTGPDLTHMGARTTILGNTLPTSVDNVARWIENPQQVKEGALMPDLNLSHGDATAIATYLVSLK